MGSRIEPVPVYRIAQQIERSEMKAVEPRHPAARRKPRPFPHKIGELGSSALPCEHRNWRVPNRDGWKGVRRIVC